MLMFKKCTRCLKILHLSFFHRDKNAKDGHCWLCKSCKGKYQKRWMSKLEVKEKRKLDARKYRKTLIGKAYTKYINSKCTDKRRFGGLRYIILKRDNYKCYVCNNGRKLVVHHIDGKGRNHSDSKNTKENLTTMCMSCHMKLHRKLQYEQSKNCSS